MSYPVESVTNRCRSLRFLMAALAFGLAFTFVGIPQGYSAMRDLIVLGVISSGGNNDGIALIKNTRTGKTFAARTGSEIDTGVFLSRVFRRYVVVTENSQEHRLGVGGAEGFGVPTKVVRHEGIEVKGNKVRITSAYRDHIVNNELSKILMQAAAVPQYSNGKLAGFMLTDIDPDSVYDLAGLKNGDVITAINGEELTDVGMAVKTLQSLKNENDASVTLIREDQEVTLDLEIN